MRDDANCRRVRPGRQRADLFYPLLQVDRLSSFDAAIEQAQARGEIRKDLEPFLVLDLFMGPLVSRLLLTGPLASAPHSADFPEQMIDVVLQGLAPKPAP